MAPDGLIPGDQIDRGPSGWQRRPTWSWGLPQHGCGRPKALTSCSSKGGPLVVRLGCPFIRLPFARMSPAPAPGVGRDEREAGFPELVLGALRSAFYRCMESYERHEGLGMT